MNDFDSEFDLQLEKATELRYEEHMEALMHRDSEVAIEKLGIDEAITDLELLITKLNQYGHELSLQEVLDRR